MRLNYQNISQCQHYSGYVYFVYIPRKPHQIDRVYLMAFLILKHNHQQELSKLFRDVKFHRFVYTIQLFKDLL